MCACLSLGGLTKATPQSEELLLHLEEFTHHGREVSSARLKTSVKTTTTTQFGHMRGRRGPDLQPCTSSLV